MRTAITLLTLLAALSCSNTERINDLNLSAKTREDPKENPRAFFSDKEIYDYCLHQDFPTGCLQDKLGYTHRYNKEMLDRYCNGSYFSVDEVSTVPPTLTIFCTADEYLSTHWQDEIKQHQWLFEYQHLLGSIEKQYNLPPALLAAVASPRGFEQPTEDKEWNGQTGFFQLSPAQAVTIGLPSKKRRNLQASAHALAEYLSNRFHHGLSLDAAVAPILGADAQISNRMHYLQKILGRGYCGGLDL